MSTPDDDAQRLLRAAYEAFNRRDIDAALGAMTPDVRWANGREGGHVDDHDGVRDYWTRQWAELDSSVVPRSMRVADDGRILVTVEQTVRGPDHELVAAGEVVHAFTLRHGRIARMEIERA